MTNGYDQRDIYALLRTLHANQLQMLSYLRALIGMSQTLTNMESKMTVNIDQLTAEVANNSTVTGSVVTLLQQLAAQISAIPPSSDPVTQAALDALVGTLAGNDTTIANAVVANTPVATPPVTPPPASSGRR